MDQTEIFKVLEAVSKNDALKNYSDEDIFEIITYVNSYIRTINDIVAITGTKKEFEENVTETRTRETLFVNTKLHELFQAIENNKTINYTINTKQTTEEIKAFSKQTPKEIIENLGNNVEIILKM